MTGAEMVGQASAASAMSTLFFTVGAVLQRSNTFDLGLFLALLVPFCAGVPGGIAWYHTFHTEALTKITAWMIVLVGLLLVWWSFTVGPEDDDDA